MQKYSPTEADASAGSTYTAEFLRVRALAERGVANAQHSLGFMYFNGQGVEQSYEQAVAWYRLAATAGLEHAQYNLGVMYQKGQGVALDYHESARWYRLAAEQGYAAAQYNLGWLYAKGQGIAQDSHQACGGSARRPSRATPARKTISA